MNNVTKHVALSLAAIASLGGFAGIDYGHEERPQRRSGQADLDRIEAARVKRERKNQKRLRTAELARDYGLIED